MTNKTQAAIEDLNIIIGDFQLGFNIEPYGTLFSKIQCHNNMMTLEKVRAELQSKPVDVDVEEWAKFIISHVSREFYGDHGCKECYPYSDMLLDGFQCALHEAEGYLNTTQTEDTE